MTDQVYYSLITDIGKTKEAAAHVDGLRIVLTHMALGDGSGEAYDPTGDQTALRNERHRMPLAELRVDEANPHWFVAETLLPGDVGGWMIRETGLIDADGDLYAIARFPETYKPVLAMGAAKELIIQMIFEVVNPDAVTVTIDPSIVLATRQYVDERIGAPGSWAAKFLYSQGV